jgi:hypothetical protein
MNEAHHDVWPSPCVQKPAKRLTPAAHNRPQMAVRHAHFHVQWARPVTFSFVTCSAMHKKQLTQAFSCTYTHVTSAGKLAGWALWTVARRAVHGLVPLGDRAQRSHHGRFRVLCNVYKLGIT